MKGIYIFSGVVLGFGLAFCMGQAGDVKMVKKPEAISESAEVLQEKEPAAIAEKPDLQGQNGRYQISAGPVTGVFIVDTQTGRVWRCLREGDKAVWYDYGDPSCGNTSDTK